MGTGVNTKLIYIDLITIDQLKVQVRYSVAPFYFKRSSEYFLEEVLYYLATEDRQRFEFEDFFFENSSQVMGDAIAEFHYKQQSISLKRHIERLNRTISRLTEKLKQSFIRA